VVSRTNVPVHSVRPVRDGFGDAAARDGAEPLSVPAAPAPSGMHDYDELHDISLVQLRDALIGSVAESDGPQRGSAPR